PASWAAIAMVFAPVDGCDSTEEMMLMKIVPGNLLKLILVLGLLFGFHTTASAQRIRVITTVPDLADITKQIGKQMVEVESLTRGVEFMHAVPVKPSFVPKLNRAQVLVVMGLDLEGSWLPALHEVAGNPKIMPGQTGYIDCSTGVNVLEVPKTLDRAEGDVHPRGNPHYNLDPLNGRIIARNIADGLSRNFPQHTAIFEKNLVEYLGELNKAITRWEAMAVPLKDVKVVAYHRDWSYFASRFGMQMIGSIETKPGIEPTPNHLISLARRMQQEKAQIIIYGPQSDRFPRQLAQQTGAIVVRLQSIAGALPETDTYIKFIDYNLRSLLSAVKKE
ncbi:MAG TPA: metal ABC transporter substrate-binding protein, partial [Candidatus Binatia bacterium]|nr:metal ABC transporter substrate-binding protein [Candidatus Binatia bacterium]